MAEAKKKKATATKTKTTTTKKTATPKKKITSVVKVAKKTPENAVPHVAISAEGVLLECEAGYIRVVERKGLKKVLKEVNAELHKLTDGAVAITEAITFEVNGVDTCELKEDLWY